MNMDRDYLPVVAIPVRKITSPPAAVDFQQLLRKCGTHEHLPRSWWIVEEPSPVQGSTDAVLVHDSSSQVFHSTAPHLLPHSLVLTISPFLLP